MGARRKLNERHVVGSIGLAALIGCLAGSWAVFLLVATALIGSACYSGEIRRGKDGKW